MINRIATLILAAGLVIGYGAVQPADAAAKRVTAEYSASSLQPSCFDESRVQAPIQITRTEARPRQLITLSWVVVNSSDTTVHQRTFRFRGKSTVVVLELDAADDAMYGLTLPGAVESFFNDSVSGAFICDAL